MSRLTAGPRRPALMSMPQVKPTSAPKLRSTPRRTRADQTTNDSKPATASPTPAQEAQPAAIDDHPVAADVQPPAGAAAVPSSSNSAASQQHGSLLDQINAPSDLKKLSVDQ